MGWLRRVRPFQYTLGTVRYEFDLLLRDRPMKLAFTVSFKIGWKSLLMVSSILSIVPASKVTASVDTLSNCTSSFMTHSVVSELTAISSHVLVSGMRQATSKFGRSVHVALPLHDQHIRSRTGGGGEGEGVGVGVGVEGDKVEGVVVGTSVGEGGNMFVHLATIVLVGDQ